MKVKKRNAARHAVGEVSASQGQDGFSPFGVKLMISQGFSVVIDSGAGGLGAVPAGCGSCGGGGGGGSIPPASQMLRFWWPRLWRSTWQHPGSLGRGMYNG